MNSTPNKTWWKFADGNRIDISKLRGVLLGRRETVYIYVSDNSNANYAYDPGEEGYEDAKALLKYIDEELCINAERE